MWHTPISYFLLGAYLVGLQDMKGEENHILASSHCRQGGGSIIKYVRRL